LPLKILEPVVANDADFSVNIGSLSLKDPEKDPVNDPVNDALTELAIIVLYTVTLLYVALPSLGSS
jgi:hypothetical protein